MEEYLIYGPVWLTCHFKAGSQKLPWCISTGIVEPENAAVLPLFTDDALAFRYIEESGEDDLAPIIFRRKEKFFAVIEWMKELGVKHVTADAAYGSNPRGEVGKWIDIANLPHICREWKDD